MRLKSAASLSAVLLAAVLTGAADSPPVYKRDLAVLARYDHSKPVVVRGFLQSVDHSGPTTWLTIRSEQETSDLWRFETAAPKALRSSGMAARLVEGARIIIRGYAAAAEPRTAGADMLAAYPPDKHVLEGRGGELTDEALASYVAAPWSQGYWQHRRDVLGRHNGARVIAEHPCGDICPHYTARIIRYDVIPGPECDRIGGVSHRIKVFPGLGGSNAAYCVPKVLVDRGLTGRRGRL